MAYTEAMVQSLNSDGVTLTYAAAPAGGITFTYTGREIVHVKNGGASPINVTAVAKTECNQGELHNKVIAVANASEKMIDRLDPSQFKNANGKIEIDFSAVTSVTYAVYTP